MKTQAPKSLVRIVTAEFFPIFISVFSLCLSTFNLYVNYLKSPDIDFVIAPYINQVVDARSQNEAFFIPLTVINRGARPGTALSFSLTVINTASQGQSTYFAQYYGQPGHQATVGDFFTPLSLNGYSSTSETLCFYPPGSRAGNFFAQKGSYQFNLTAVIANVQDPSQRTITRSFNVALTDGMFTVMQSQPGGEYPYPIPIETPTLP